MFESILAFWIHIAETEWKLFFYVFYFFVFFFLNGNFPFLGIPASASNFPNNFETISNYTYFNRFQNKWEKLEAIDKSGSR